MTPPVLVYLACGLLVARIKLDGTLTRGYTWLQWLQFLFDAARITLLWPLVLLIEKVTIWLKAGAENPVLFSNEARPDKPSGRPTEGERP